jgi:hypothetical protein
MKKIAIALTLLISSSVHAGDYEFCKVVEGFAEQVMLTRQAGVAASEAYSATQDNKLMSSMVKVAYKRPAYDTEQFRQQAVDEFKDEWFVLCMEDRE